MGGSIRVLIVDDSEDDALLIAEELRDAGYDLTFLRVDTPEDMRDALRAQVWSLVIADYKMPHFSGEDALRVLQESGLDLPFILVSGTAPENIGVEMMHAGAQDFILKSSLSRLQPAVARELADVEARGRTKIAEEAARISSENYRTIFECAPVVILAFDREGVIVQANPAFEQAFERGGGSVLGKHVWLAFGRPDRKEEFLDVVARVFLGETIRNVEWEYHAADGSTRHFLTNISPVKDDHGDVSMGLAMSTDITDRKLDEQRQQAMTRHKREFYRRTIMAATGGKLVIAEPEEIYGIAGPPLGDWSVSSLADIERARNEIREQAASLGMVESQTQAFTGCGIEAMANVWKHAGGGRVTLHKDRQSLVLVVSDTGPGIEALSLPDVALKKGYTTAASLGMGYKVMIEFADRVYLATGPEGTVVAVQMKLKPEMSVRESALEALSGW